MPAVHKTAGGLQPPENPNLPYLFLLSLSPHPTAAGTQGGGAAAHARPGRRERAARPSSARRGCVPPSQARVPSSAARRRPKGPSRTQSAAAMGRRGQLRPMAGLSAAAGPERRPAASRNGGNGEAAGVKPLGTDPQSRCRSWRRRQQPSHGLKVSFRPFLLDLRVMVNRIQEIWQFFYS